MCLFSQAMKMRWRRGHIVFRILDVDEDPGHFVHTDRMEEMRDPGGLGLPPRTDAGVADVRYCCGASFRRKDARRPTSMIPFRVLTGDQHPPFHVINEFRCGTWWL